MIVKDLYDKATTVAPMTQAEFLTFLAEGVGFLSARFGVSAVFENGVAAEAVSVEDSLPVYDAWKQSLLNYVIYSKNGDQLRRSEFEASLDYAYRTVWKGRMRGKNRYRVPHWY